MRQPLFLLFFLVLTKAYSVDFVLFTQPKTGTHLIAPILYELTGKSIYWAQEFRDSDLQDEGNCNLEENEKYVFSLTKEPWDLNTMKAVWGLNKAKGCFLHLHPPFTLSMEQFLIDNNCISFFVKRDPRDQVVSLLNHYKKFGFTNLELESLSSDDERLLYMITHDLRKNTLPFMGWINSQVCCVLEFSKLMGSHGGAATDLDAINEVQKIAVRLGLHMEDEQSGIIYEKCFGKSWNFHKGKVGTWKEYFNSEHVAACKEAIGDLLIGPGYEKDYNW